MLYNPNTNSEPMNTIKLACFLFLTFFFCCSFSNPLQASASEHCSANFCSRMEPVIRFPFRLHNLQPEPCGFHGFELLCDAFNQTLIDLPNSGRFTVQAINYAKQQIWLNDPEDCLPRRLLELNLTGSPFNGFFYQDFTLFNCTLDYRMYKLDPIACLSGKNYTVFASSSERVIRSMASACGVVATVAVPVQWDFLGPVMTSDLSDNIRLAWSSPRCQRCESGGGHCGFSSVNSTVVVCRDIPRSGLPRYAIIVGAAMPALVCLLGFACYLCSRLKRLGRQHHPVMDLSMAVVPPPATAISGLDGPTIDSYPKTILGESRRLPKPDDYICSICLSEYMPKDTLRTIPECQHCFHAECIDEWLQLNASCPVCRNSPKSSPLTQSC